VLYRAADRPARGKAEEQDQNESVGNLDQDQADSLNETIAITPLVPGCVLQKLEDGHEPAK